MLAVLFACNGIVLAASCNPHFELLIVASGMAFLAALVCGRLWLAVPCFVLCLMTREDAGFHLGLLLLACSFGLRWQGVAWAGLRPLLGYAAVAIGWSVLSVAAQHVFFPGQGSLRGVYLGSPPFAGITPAILAARLTFSVLYRLYLILPVMIGLVLAERWRMPGLVAGFISCVPWLALNLLATSSYAGTFSNYYPFPMIFGLFWPVASQIFAERLGAVQRLPRRHAIGAFAAMLLASFIGLWGLQNPQSLRFPASFFNPPSLQVQHTTERAMIEFRTAPLGRVAVDGSVIALDPNHYREAQLVWWPQPILPNTIIFFPHGQGTSHALALASQAGLKRFYQVPGTSLRVATNQKLDLKALNLAPWAPAPQ